FVFSLRLMPEIETHVKPLVSSHETDFFDHAVCQPTTTFRQICVAAEASVLRSKNELNGLTFTESFGFLFSRQACRSDFHGATAGHAEQQIRRAQKCRD